MMITLLEVNCIHGMLQVDYGRGTKAAGYYVQYPSGLFPAPLPQTDYDRMSEVETLFRCVGTLFAKCVQDGRLVDIPLSRPLLKLMCGGDLSDAVSRHRSCSSTCISHSSDEDLTPTEPMVTPPVDPWFVSPLPKVFVCGFRRHRSTMYIHAAYCYRPSSVLCLLVCLSDAVSRS